MPSTRAGSPSPSPSPRIPAYCLHKGKQLAYCTVAGRQVYLGPHGSPASHARYQSLINELIATRAIAPPGGEHASSALMLGELCVAWWDAVSPDYAPTTRATSRLAISQLSDLFAALPVLRFGPAELKAYRKGLIDQGLARSTINQRIGVIKRLFAWAVEEGHIPPHILTGVSAVRGLRKFRGGAKEPEPIRPVADPIIDATLPHLPPVVADMVRVQRLTGMRPGELCSMTPADLDTSSPGGAWLYDLGRRHKTALYGKSRTVAIGPRAQAILARYLSRSLSAPIFSPAESESRRPRKNGSPRKLRRSGRPIHDRYTRTSYARAIARACDKAFPPPADLPVDQLAAWRKSHRWSPNQLRHARATELRRTMGLETSKAVLGHSKVETTQVYAERDQALAREAAIRTG